MVQFDHEKLNVYQETIRLGFFYFDFACFAEEVAKNVLERDTLALS